MEKPAGDAGLKTKDSQGHSFLQAVGRACSVSAEHWNLLQLLHVQNKEHFPYTFKTGSMPVLSTYQRGMHSAANSK